MTQDPQKNNSVLIVIAVIGVVGTIVASAIGAMANYNIEKERQGFELTRIALVSIATQGGVTQMALESTVNAPPESTSTSYPTYTPFPTLPPTETPIPTATATLFVPPADGILFQDNFESGDLSAWTQYSGKWIISNGALSMLGDKGNSFNWIALNKPEWKNYVLSLNINIPHQGAASQQHLAVAVRNEGSQANYIGVTVETMVNNVYWAFIEADQTPDIAGDNRGSSFFESGSNMEIEVVNDTFTLRVNGRKIQSLTMPGYGSGGISLGIMCTDYSDCPSFDNVKVTYLP